MTSSSKDYYRELMARADIVAVAGVVLAGRSTGASGVELTYDCPRHESQSKKSLTINAETSVWHCWGCDEGGDALHLVEFVRTGSVTKGCSGAMPQSHRDARDELADMVGMPRLSGLKLTDEQRAELEARHQEREQVLNALDGIAELYHQALLANDEVLAWVEEKYGFGRAQVEEFRLGWANDPGAGARLVGQGLGADLLPKTGAFKVRRGRLRPFFSGRLVLPYFDRGRVAYLIGRRTDWTPDKSWEKAKYKKLPTHDPKKYPHVSPAIDNSLLWGESCLASRPKTLLITEGITDAMAATAAGFPTISPVTVRLKRSDFERVLPQLREIERVVLIMDNELSSIGEEAAMELAEQLREEGVAAFVAELPLQEAQDTARAQFEEILGEELVERFKAATARDRGKLLDEALADRPEDLERAKSLREDAKIDVAEWFRSGGTAGQFRKLLDAAKTLTELRIEALGSEAGAEAIHDVLEEVAKLNPVEQERCIADLHARTGTRVGALREELKPLAREARKTQARSRASAESEGRGSYYEARQDGLYIVRMKDEGPVPTRLTNFTAAIAAAIQEDDGVETSTLLEIEVGLGTGLHLIQVSSRSFGAMNWAMEQVGPEAIVSAGQSIRDQARQAVQELSPHPVPKRRTYVYTGWCEIQGIGSCYLHAGGAIGPEGPVSSGVEVRLSGPIEKYNLSPPPEGAELVAAGRRQLRLLEIAPPRIAYPTVAVIWRAVQGSTDFAGHFCGASGTFKTEVAALCQSHWGARMDARNLPGSWSSTGNALEGAAFQAKDSLLVVDDFAPTGSSHDVQRYHREADRLIRAQGNWSGRGRMRADGTLRPPKPPRGTILSTGEDIPAGQSLRARMFIVEFSAGDVDIDVLSECQRDAREGVYASVMAAFIRWVAARRQELLAKLQERAIELRNEAAAEDRHRRAPSMIGQLQAGWEVFLAFAVEAGILSATEADAHRRGCWQALGEMAETQSAHVADSEPTALLFRLLASAIAAGEGHVANPFGGAPENAQALGWRMRGVRGEGGEAEEVPYEQGPRVGWIDGDNLYLNLETALKVAQRTGSDSERLTIGSRALAKRLSDRKLLVTEDRARGKHTVRVELEGSRKYVVHVDASHLLVRALRAPQARGDAGQPDQDGYGPETGARNGHGSGVSGPAFGPRAKRRGRPWGAPAEARGGDGPQGPEGPEPTGGEHAPGAASRGETPTGHEEDEWRA